MKNSLLILLILFICVSFLFIGYNFGISKIGSFKDLIESSEEHNSPPSVVIEPGSGVETASYIIFKDDEGFVYAKNGNTGEIEFQDTNAATVINQAVGNLPDEVGGVIWIGPEIETSGTVVIDKSFVTLTSGGTVRAYARGVEKTPFIAKVVYNATSASQQQIRGGGLKGIFLNEVHMISIDGNITNVLIEGCEIETDSSHRGLVIEGDQTTVGYNEFVSVIDTAFRVNNNDWGAITLKDVRFVQVHCIDCEFGIYGTQTSGVFRSKNAAGTIRVTNSHFYVGGSGLKRMVWVEERTVGPYATGLKTVFLGCNFERSGGDGVLYYWESNPSLRHHVSQKCISSTFSAGSGENWTLIETSNIRWGSKNNDLIFANNDVLGPNGEFYIGDDVSNLKADPSFGPDNIVVRIEGNVFLNPIGVLSAPFDSTMDTVGLGGDASNPTANHNYTIWGCSLMFDITGGTNANVKLYDGDGNIISNLGNPSSNPIHGLYVPIGYKINFGGFTEAPTVVVAGD